MCCDESIRLDVMRLKRCVSHLCTEVSTLRRQANGASSLRLRGVEQQVLEAGSEEPPACDSQSSVEELLKRIEQQGYVWRLFSPPFNSYGYVHNRDKCPDVTKYELIVWNSEHRHREFYGDTLREAVEQAAATLRSQR